MNFHHRPHCGPILIRRAMSSPAPLLLACGCLFLACCWGCDHQGDSIADRRPRPVEVQQLVKQPPPSSSLVAASVGSWKTEQIGFEVGGRIEFVVERNTEIEGRIFDQDGNLISAGTPVARIENERFKLAVLRAESEVTRAEQNLEVAKTNLLETIPAQIDAANANADLARAEYDRQTQLMNRNAGSRGDFDVAEANWRTAQSQVKESLAAQKAKQAEITALINAVSQAKQSLRDANRDLEDCTLYASFGGLVPDTSVVPGSIVTAGEPVATLQMMDPIKVELEVSAEDSRRLRRTEIFPVHVTMPDGRIELHDGFLYQIDTLADPRTRTFTLTLLVLNQKLREFFGTDVATTRDIWRLDLSFLPGAEPDSLFIEENSICRDDQGAYLWQITNATIQERSLEDQVFEVKKLRIKPRSRKIPYLGNLIFQQIDVLDPKFDPSVNLVVGELLTTDGTPQEWNGTQVYLDSGVRWMLRPGDLVKVDLSSGNQRDGYYVPMDAISHRNGEAAIFVLEQQGAKTMVKRMPVVVTEPHPDEAKSSLRHIDPPAGVSLEGLRYVSSGAHFLIDGEPVAVVSRAEAVE